MSRFIRSLTLPVSQVKTDNRQRIFWLSLSGLCTKGMIDPVVKTLHYCVPRTMILVNEASGGSIPFMLTSIDTNQATGELYGWSYCASDGAPQNMQSWKLFITND